LDRFQGKMERGGSAEGKLRYGRSLLNIGPKTWCSIVRQHGKVAETISLNKRICNEQGAMTSATPARGNWSELGQRRKERVKRNIEKKSELIRTAAELSINRINFQLIRRDFRPSAIYL